MADLVFNIAKGRAAELAGLSASDDALILVPLEEDDLADDATLVDMDSLDAILSGTTNEQTTLGRKTLANVTVTVDDVNDRVNIDADDVVWTSASGNAIGAVVICYDPDTTGGTDADLVPLVKLDAAATPSGGDITLQFDAEGFYRAA